MSTKGQTKDESFMRRLYQEASKKESIDEPIDRYVIGGLIGLQKKAVDTICNNLAQANFIKKEGDSEVSLTPQGLRLIQSL
jgi:Mn-dependent DtxR family transcriptional regulator